MQISNQDQIGLCRTPPQNLTNNRLSHHCDNLSLRWPRIGELRFAWHPAFGLVSRTPARPGRFSSIFLQLYGSGKGSGNLTIEFPCDEI